MLCFGIYARKCFGLRGGDEHRNLMREQFSINSESVGRHLWFIGRSSKNRDKCRSRMQCLVLERDVLLMYFRRTML